MEHPRCSKDLGQRVSRSSYGNCGDSEEIQLLGPWWGLAVPQPTIAMSRTPVSFGWHVARDVTVLRSRIDEAIYQFGLPEDAEMNRILRYQSAVQRQLTHAINQLERLQRARKGEHVPAPVSVQLSSDQ